MPFDPGLASRLEDVMQRHHSGEFGLEETRMFGGFGYLLNGNMCLGIHKDRLIIRIGLEQAEKIIGEPGIGPMDLTGRVMKGWAMVQPEAMEEDQDLARFAAMAIAFAGSLPPKEKKGG